MRMKKQMKLLTFLLLIAAVASCNQNEYLSDEDRINAERIAIIENLADVENYVFKPELLVGTWKPVKFAYTNDGKQISGEDFISTDFTVEMKYNELPIEAHPSLGTHRLTAYFGERFFRYKTSSYFVDLESKALIYKGVSLQYSGKLTEDINRMITQLTSEIIDFDWVEFFAGFEPVEPVGEELKLYNAFSNAYSFVIKNDELVVTFTGNTNKNLLILKKN